MKPDIHYEKFARRAGPVMGISEGVILYRPLPSNVAMSAWCGTHFPEGYKGWAVDVGASDGISVNSTYALEKDGWAVICVEPNPHFKPYLIQHRTLIETCALSDQSGEAELHVNLGNFEAYSGLVPQRHHPMFQQHAGDDWESLMVRTRTLDSLLDQYEFPQLDALFIDTEGNECDVLKGCDLNRWKPKVVVVESWDEGALDGCLPGYHRHWRQADNDCYVRKA